LKKYFKKNKHIDHEVILSSDMAPFVSVLAPAYNESASIVQSVRAFLSLTYHSFEVVVINDGSTDDTLEKLIATYGLEKVPYAFDQKVRSEKVKAAYKSRHASYNRLLVIDKENGGKADALNAGINVSSGELFLALDVDSIVEPDALLKMVKPFLDSEQPVIASGGVVRIANSCRFEDGKLIERRVPGKLLPRIQVLEYSVAFLMGRIGWTQLGGLLLVSGALGLFDKTVAIACGGYNPDTVGEDLELIVRMRKYMASRKSPYKVVYIPDPLIWTEVPGDLKTLGKQRNRWTRGSIDTLIRHSDLFMNRKYGIMGWLSYPYWLVFEWLAPILETLSILLLIGIALAGASNWNVFFSIIIFVYTFAILYFHYTILLEELTFHKYNRIKDLLMLFAASWLYPLIYHPLIVLWALKGNWDYFVTRNDSWGENSKQGFS
ncbi:MAG: glycosyltransferase, partial [Bacteroidales bacterium]|nr:glycosyltransferase [Bacteroidales bacterium]